MRIIGHNLERTQTRRMIEDLRGHDYLVCLRQFNESFKPTPNCLGRADYRIVERAPDPGTLELSPPLFRALEWGREKSGPVAAQVEERPADADDRHEGHRRLYCART